MEFYQFISQDQKVQINGQKFHNAVCESDGYPQWSSIENCTFSGSCHFTFDSGDIVFADCDFKQCNSVIFEFKNSGSVKFGNCIIGTDLRIFQADSVIIIDCEIEGVISFSQEKYKIVEIVNEKTSHRINKIEFWNASEDPKSKIRLNNLHVGELKFHEKYPTTLHIFGGNYGNIEMNYAHGLNDLIIAGDEMKKLKIKIAKLSMTFYNFNGLARIKDAMIENWNLSQFSNLEGTFKLQNVHFTGSVEIIGSDMKGVQFNDVNFRNSRMYLDWSILGEAKFTNIIWPDRNLIHSIVTETNELRLGSLTEVYRQLKKLSLNDSNNIQALHFYRNEMDSYWKRVQLDKSEKWWNRLLICINKYSSNFGQSYWIPFWWIIIGHFLMCTAIWNFEARQWCVCGTRCSSDFYVGFAQYLNWLIPFYKQPENWTDKSIIIGAFMRVYNGFFIYHFIKATRKFGKV
jgi:hypothetical protein